MSKISSKHYSLIDIAIISKAVFIQLHSILHKEIKLNYKFLSEFQSKLIFVILIEIIIIEESSRVKIQFLFSMVPGNSFCSGIETAETASTVTLTPIPLQLTSYGFRVDHDIAEFLKK
jgi:hypothetical protein